jgi:hypothetical protein
MGLQPNLSLSVVAVCFISGVLDTASRMAVNNAASSTDTLAQQRCNGWNAPMLSEAVSATVGLYSLCGLDV